MDKLIFEQHSSEGAELIMASPKLGWRTIFYAVSGLIVAGLVWAFIGKADVVISCDGEVAPTQEPRRVYSPVPGELVNVFFIKGESVEEGTMLARIKSPEAITLATRARSALSRFEAARREYDLVADRHRLMTRQLELLRKRKEFQEASIGDTEEQIKIFDEAQKLKTEIIQDRIRRTDGEIQRARENYERYKTMFAAGAVSENEYRDQQIAWKLAEDNSKSVRLQASAEYAQALDERRERMITLDLKRNFVLEMDLEIRRMQDQIANMETVARQEFDLARVEMEAAQLITHQDLDQDNLLKIRAPVSGIITDVSFTQSGDKVSASTPFFTISPDRERCMMIRISDQDRAFIEPGMPVKIKVNAFPHMRFGFLSGSLDSITPTTRLGPDGVMSYEGKVIFDRNPAGEPQDYFMVGGQKRSVRFGMSARAEVVVERRRLVEFALDSFRKMKP